MQVIYKCETCQFESLNRESVLLCETSHRASKCNHILNTLVESNIPIILDKYCIDCCKVFERISVSRDHANLAKIIESCDFVVEKI